MYWLSWLILGLLQRYDPKLAQVIANIERARRRDAEYR